MGKLMMNIRKVNRNRSI